MNSSVMLSVSTKNLSFVIAFIALSIFNCRSQVSKQYSIYPETNESTGEYLKKSFWVGKDSLNFRIVYPEGFDLQKKYPLLLFLHGSGERGSDNTAQLVHGGEMIKNGSTQYQYIAIFPQCPKEDYWVKLLETEERRPGVRTFEPDVENGPSDALGKVIQLISEYRKFDFVDKDRIYVAGLSMGGMATYDLLWRLPETFAAAMPICGAGSQEKAQLFSHVPIRIFHGQADVVVGVEESLEMIEALKLAGGEPEVFLYPEVNHNSWENAFAEPDFLSWLFQHKKDH